MNAVAPIHPPRPPLVALIWLKNTMQLFGLVKTSHLGYFLVRVYGLAVHTDGYYFASMISFHTFFIFFIIIEDNCQAL